MTQAIAITVLVLFAAGMLLIGFYSKKRANSIDGFLLGGRRMGPWVSAIAYGTSYFSAVIFIGYAGKHGWDVGLGSLWIGIGNALIAALASWLLLASRTRSMTRRLNSRTMPEFFGSRYASDGMKVFAAVIIFIFLVPYAASVYKGLGVMFSAVFPGMPEWSCMLIVALLTAAYLMLGGYVATALNDLIQGVIMIGGIVVMIAVLLARPEVGGFSGMYDKLAAIDEQLVAPLGGDSFGFLAVNIALTSFAVWGMPQMLHKYYAIKDESSIRRGAVISTVFCLITGCGAYFVGSMGHLFIDAAENGMPALEGGYDAIVPTVLYRVFSQSFALNIVLAVVLLLLLSASMSTLSAVVLTSSSAISVDLTAVACKDISPRRQISLTRVLCVVFVALSYFFAIQNISFIVNLMSFAWGVVAGCFIGPFIWGLYSRRTTRAGAWAGMLSGVVTMGALIIITTLTKDCDAAKNDAALFGCIAMAVSFAIVPLVSAITPKLSPKVVSSAFDAPADEQ